MKDKGKSVEIIDSKSLFGKETLWIHILEDDSFVQVLRTDLEDNITSSSNTGRSYKQKDYQSIVTVGDHIQNLTL